MAQAIFALIFFGLGYYFYKIKFSENHKKYIFSTSKLIEINFYVVLKDFIEMHTYGSQALKLTLEKLSEENPELKEEYQKVCEMYDKKFEQFGNHYFSIMKNIFPYELKYNSYQQVKDEFNKLFIK